MESTAYLRYHKFKDANKVIFPKKYVNDGTIKPIKYEIFLVKDIEDGDRKRLVRDSMGRLVDEEPMFNIWTILHSSDFEIEETFWVFGQPSKKDRKTIHDVARIIMSDAKEIKKNRQVIVVHNKLVIHNDERFDMIICKNKRDCQRLHHLLKNESIKFKLKGLLFMGTCSRASMPMLYEIIHINTGWEYRKIRRTSTRP
jgi:hypothetical protein